MKKFENIAQIKAERERQRKDPVIYSLLGVLLGEIDRLPIPRTESPSEDQIYTIIKKLYESADIMKQHNSDAATEFMYLHDYIKPQLGTSEIETIISEMILENPKTNIGDVMKYFKNNYNGMYDGKVVSQAAKLILK